MNLADLYDGDQRTRDPRVRAAAGTSRIPHPLHGVPYADGVDRCGHGRRCITPTGRPAVTW